MDMKVDLVTDSHVLFSHVVLLAHFGRPDSSFEEWLCFLPHVGRFPMGSLFLLISCFSSRLTAGKHDQLRLSAVTLKTVSTLFQDIKALLFNQ